MTFSLDKKLLRERILAQRSAVAVEDAQHAAARAARHALNVLHQIGSVQSVGFYHAVRGELECLPLAELVHARGMTLALPALCTSGDAKSNGSPMVFREWVFDAPLNAGYAGIPQPPEHARVLVPDVIFVPLVAFDRDGYRLGYGKGFYDRTLPLLRAQKECRFYGYGYALQEVAGVPHEAHDVRLDGMVTEHGFFEA